MCHSVRLPLSPHAFALLAPFLIPLTHLRLEPCSGRPRTHPWADLVVDTQASQSPPCSGHVQTCWSVGLLGAFLARRFGIRVSGASLRRALHRQGWRWARPRLAPVYRCRVDPEAEEKVAALVAA